MSRQNTLQRVFTGITFISVLFVFAIFLKSYFPSKSAVEGYAESHSIQETLGSSVHTNLNAWELKPLYGRFIFVLIDALRKDFVMAGDSPMTFVSEALKQRYGLAFTAKAHPPTVTLPRIKALTTGSIPGFVDVVLNFGSSSLQEDNLISQMKRHNKRLVFYGDDTWLRLFPNHFVRSDGTTSFFVTDYTEVDDNVTRHLTSEFREATFDTLILHYLGLDHIGHLAGPKSLLVKPKLQEMDRIVKDIFDSVGQYKDELPPLIMVCGDHGMSDQGSHGGASISETLVPVVFLSPKKQFTENLRKEDLDSEISQIDVVPTLSILLGLPIPQNNLGKLVDGMLDGLTLQQKLTAWHTNAYQVLQVFKKNVPNYEQDPAFLAYERSSKGHIDWLSQVNGSLSPVSYRDVGIRVSHQYREAIVAMTTKISSSLTQYDMYGLMSTIFTLLMILIALILLGSQNYQHIHWTTIFSVLIGVLVSHMTICTSQSGKTSSLCRQDVESVLLQIGIVFVFVLTTSFCVTLITRHVTLGTSNKILSKEPIRLFLVVGTVLHTLSLGSSSFVEEEHQTWYFITITIHFVIILQTVKRYYKQYNKAINSETLYNQVINSKTPDSYGEKSKVFKQTDILEIKLGQQNDVKFRDAFENSGDNSILSDTDSLNSYKLRLRSENVNIFKNEKFRKQKLDASIMNTDQEINAINFSSRNRKCNASDIDGIQKFNSRVLGKIIFGCVSVVVISRILRRWNQTGNKWLDTPDVGDWLIRPENKTVLSVSVIVSMVTILVVQFRQMATYQIPVYATALMSTYWYRAVNGVLLSPFVTQNISKGITEARVGFIMIAVFFVMNLIKILREKYQKQEHKTVTSDLSTALFNSWILLMVLLVRPHNIPLVAMVTVQEYMISEFIFKDLHLSVPVLTLYYLWMGHAAFFYQGNSNSISTVDVSAGYIGLDDYQPVIVAILLTLSTYAGTIFWMLATVKLIFRHCNSYKDSSVRLKQSTLEFCHAILLCRVLPLSFYTVIVTIQRYHLFVWTVFSPKLLYEGMTTVVKSLFCMILLLIIY